MPDSLKPRMTALTPAFRVRAHAAGFPLGVAFVLLLIGSLGLGAPGRANAAESKPRQANATSAQKVLSKPIGITTAGPVFTPLIPAGHKLPLVFSQTFGNETNGQSEILVELSQQSAAGVETIASLRIKIPAAKNGSLNVTVTLEVSETKMMTVKTTVAETASTQRFGPFAVE